MRYKFIRYFSQQELESTKMTEDERIQMAKYQAAKELAKDLMEKACFETSSNDCIKITIDIDI